MSPTNLVAARDLYREVLGQSRPKSPYILKELKAWGVQYLTTNYTTSRGTKQQEIFLPPEAVDQVRTRLAERKAKQQAAAVPAIIAPAHSGAVEATLSECIKRISALEDLYLEVSGTLDTLHKAVEQTNTTYAKLLEGIDPKTREALPKIIQLPSRYKYKIAIIGGDVRQLQHAEAQFPNLRFVQVGLTSSLGAGEIHFPRSDAAFGLTDFLRHNRESQAQKFYGKDYHRVKGSASALVAAISVWLHEKEKAA